MLDKLRAWLEILNLLQSILIGESAKISDSYSDTHFLLFLFFYRKRGHVCRGERSETGVLASGRKESIVGSVKWSAVAFVTADPLKIQVAALCRASLVPPLRWVNYRNSSANFNGEYCPRLSESRELRGLEDRNCKRRIDTSSHKLKILVALFFL